MRVMIMAVSLMILCSSISLADSWWDGHWQYRQRVDINAPEIAEDMTDFTLWMQLKDTQFARTLAQADGRDLRAVSAYGKTLPLEIVSWSQQGIRVCVRIPRISKLKSDRFFWLYFGNSRAEVAKPATVWDANRLGVFHLYNNVDNAVKISLRLEPTGHVAQHGWAPGMYLGHHNPWVSLYRAQPGFLKASAETVKTLGQDFTLACRIRPRGEGHLTVFSSDRYELSVETHKLVLQNRAGRELSVDRVSPDQWHSVVFTARADGECILSLDGTQFASGVLPAGADKPDRMYYGRSVTDAPDSQFNGDIEEIRLLNAARPKVWVLATAMSLSDSCPLVTTGDLEHMGKPTGLPAPPALCLPFDGMQAHRGVKKLEWNGSVGADEYCVRIYADRESAKLLKSIDVGKQTSFDLSAEQAGAATIYWTAVAKNSYGEVRSKELRRFTFVDWNKPADVATQTQVVQPEMVRPADLRIELDGYLRERVDQLVKFWIDMPDKNPGMLRILRERPQMDLLPWAGIYGGQYINSGQALWRLTHNEALKKRMDRFVKEYIACQRDDGYLGPFADLSGHIDIWSHYAIIDSLVNYYSDTGYQPALEAAQKAADLVIRVYGPQAGAYPKIGGGTEAMSHAMVLLYKETKEPRYLNFANYIVSEASNELDGVSYFRLGKEHRPIVEFPACRWEGVHNTQTLPELYWLNGDSDYRKAYEYLWWTMLRSDRHNTGGFTTDEALRGTPYAPGAIETCCTVAWIALSTDMLKLTGDSRAADELEWSTLNSALGSFPSDGSYAAYANQPDGRRKYGELVQGPADGPLLSCCSTNAPRAIGMIADWALMRKSDGLVLNYYGPSTMSATLETGQRITLKQVTEYPAKGDINIQVTVSEPSEFTVYLRIPKWSAHTRVTVNGEPQPQPVAGSYMVLRRRWQTGDVLHLALDFSLRVWKGEENYADKVSLYQGPILLSCDTRYDRSQSVGSKYPINMTGAHIEPVAWKGSNAPWLLTRLVDGDGHEFKLCDYASAGMSGSYYQSWFGCTQRIPSPFYLEEPHFGETGIELNWEARSGADHWVVIVSQGKDMAAGRRCGAVKGLKLVLPKMKPGRYYWTVMAESPYGETESANGPHELHIP